jgi:hypothetical protein
MPQDELAAMASDNARGRPQPQPHDQIKYAIVEVSGGIIIVPRANG